jgi:salicylate hydroxylase
VKDSNVIVVGAGIGGLAAALALLRAGQRVRIYEQVAELGEVGAGLSITPNAGKALVALGLREALERMGSRPPAGVIRHYSTGEILVRLAQDQTAERYGLPLHHVHRADLHSALADAVRALDPQCLATGRGVIAVDSRAGGVTAELHDGSRAEAEWLVGADGIHSVTRAALFGPDRPNFTGYLAYRGLVPGELVPPDLLDPPLCMTVGPRRLLMRYPLRRGTLVNIVAIAQRAAWTEEGWSVGATRAELLEEFADFEPHARRLLELVPPEKLFKWGLFDRDPLPTWTQGRATLLGDAAHAMPPFTGQGAVMALEDAAVLGRAAAAAATPDEALQRYEVARHPRVTAALVMSRARALTYFADDPAQQLRALGEGMAELRTLYDYDAGSVDV